MHVEFAVQAQEWGGWRFGDLAVAICRAVEVVGPAADVVWLSVRQPATGPVQVCLWVAGVEEVRRLREETEHGEYAAGAWWIDGIGWHTVVNGISLQVTTNTITTTGGAS